jgi:hypothetical protein
MNVVTAAALRKGQAKMKSFTIENETNNITAHATKQDAELVAGAECFTSETSFASLAAVWPTARLIEIWNSLPGETPVTKFKDRKTAVARIWKAIQSLADAPVAAPKAAPQAHVAPTRAKTGKKATAPKGSPERTTEAKGSREGSKTSRVIGLLKREGGVTLKEIMAEMGWQSHTTRALMSTGGSLTKKHGLTVVSTKGENGDRIYSISA